MTSEEASENFLDFNRRLNIIYQNTSNENKSRIHYKSLRNFIYRYNSSKKVKTKCTELLKGYIELIEGQNFFFTEEQSKASFDLYIGPLGQNFYSRYVNFSTTFSIVSNFYFLASLFILFGPFGIQKLLYFVFFCFTLSIGSGICLSIKITKSMGIVIKFDK